MTANTVMMRVSLYRWRFAQTPERIYNQGSAEILPDADVKDLGGVLLQKGYQVFRQGPSLYAFKGLAGRLGPIGVHASMLAIMAGVAIGGLGGYKGSVMVPTGGDFLVAQVSQALQYGQAAHSELISDGSIKSHKRKASHAKALLS